MKPKHFGSPLRGTPGGIDLATDMPSYLDLCPEAPEPQRPVGAGWWATRKWIKARQKLEYTLFCYASYGGIWASAQWSIVRDENTILGVYKNRGKRAKRT